MFRRRCLCILGVRPPSRRQNFVAKDVAQRLCTASYWIGTIDGEFARLVNLRQRQWPGLRQVNVRREEIEHILEGLFESIHASLESLNGRLLLLAVRALCAPDLQAAFLESGNQHKFWWSTSRSIAMLLLNTAGPSVCISGAGHYILLLQPHPLQSRVSAGLFFAPVDHSPGAGLWRLGQFRSSPIL